MAAFNVGLILPAGPYVADAACTAVTSAFGWSYRESDYRRIVMKIIVSYLENLECQKMSEMDKRII